MSAGYLECRISLCRRRWSTAAAVLAALLLQPCVLSAQEKFPSKPIRVIVPFPPGGINDTVARPILVKMGELLNTSFVVENRPGASGTIGTAAAMRAEPDGYTLLLGAASTMAVVPHLIKTVTYSPTADFAAIGGLATVPSVLITAKAQKYPDLAAMKSESKSGKAQTTFGSAGPGTSHHMQMVFLNMKLGLPLMHVPYKGSGPAMGDLLGGQIDFLMDPLPTALPQVQAAKVSAIGISSANRSPLLPDVPTFQELGVKDFDVGTWFGLFAPVKTPKTVIAQISQALDAALRDPVISKTMLSRGMEPLLKNSAEMNNYVIRENALWKDVIEKEKISID